MPIENRPEAVEMLTLQASRALENPDKIESYPLLGIWYPILRVWRYSAFADFVSWTVLQPPSQKGRDRRWSIREVTWIRTRDLLRFSEPLEGVRRGFSAPPTLGIRDGEIAAHRVESILRALRQLPISVLGIREPISLDADQFGVETDAPLPRVRLEWSGEGPKEWRTFTRTIATLRKTLQEHLSDAPAH